MKHSPVHYFTMHTCFDCSYFIYTVCVKLYEIIATLVLNKCMGLCRNLMLSLFP